MKRIVFTIILLSATGVMAADEIAPPASLRFSKPNSRAVPDFQRHVVPLLGRLGCNSAKCHGSFQGQGGLRLSLFGFDFRSDHAALQSDATDDGTRLSVTAPHTSLLLRKPTGQADHQGGERFETGSWEHNLLLRWIESGAKGATPGLVAKISERKSKSEHAEFFEKTIRPILEDHCYECHGFSSPQRETVVGLTRRPAVRRRLGTCPGARQTGPKACSSQWYGIRTINCRCRQAENSS